MQKAPPCGGVGEALMAYVGLEKGKEVIFHWDDGLNRFVFIPLDEGDIKKLIGRSLSSRDMPVDLSFRQRAHKGSFIKNISGPEEMEEGDCPDYFLLGM